jgi:hypothetical protein
MTDAPRIQPLQGALGPRELLFTRRSSPMVAMLRRGIWGHVIALIGALVLGGVMWFTFRETSVNDAGPMLWFFATFTWVLSEAVTGAIGSRIAASEVRRWQRLQRLSEISLTLLRPITIGQLIIARSVRPVIAFIALTYLAFFVCLMRHHAEQATALIPYGFIAANAIVMVYLAAWAQLTVALGTKSNIQSFVAMSNLAAVYTLCMAPFVLALILLAMVDITLLRHTSDDVPPILIWSVPVLGSLLIALKLLFARAFAARFEQVVFPLMTFDRTESGRVQD